MPAAQEKRCLCVCSDVSALPAKDMMPITSHLGSVLRRHREALGLSLEVVAGRAGISSLALHNLETGKASSKSDTYERVAAAMGLDYYSVIVFEARIAAERAKKVL